MPTVRSCRRARLPIPQNLFTIYLHAINNASLPNRDQGATTADADERFRNCVDYSGLFARVASRRDVEGDQPSDSRQHV